MKCIDGTEAFQARFEWCVGKPSGGSYTPKKLWDFDQDTCQCERNRPVPDFKLAVKVSIVFTPNFESSKISDMVALGREVCAVLRKWTNGAKGEDCRKMVYVDPDSVRVEGGSFEAVLIFKSKFVDGLHTDADATAAMLFKYFIDQIRHSEGVAAMFQTCKIEDAPQRGVRGPAADRRRGPGADGGLQRP